jgi:putative glycosyltransferase (TIGR04372 family)
VRRTALSGSDGKRVFWWGIVTGPVANEQLLRLYARRFAISRIRNKLVHIFLRPLMHTRTSPVFENLYQFDETKCQYHTIAGAPPPLRFTPFEDEQGKEMLHRMGIGDRDWFVCLHVRDPVYLSRLYPGRDFQYHSYRDCDIKNYLEAAKYIAACGGFAVRMGHGVAAKLPDLHEPRIIDYASHYRSDAGDIYLAAKAKFFLGNTSGPFLVSMIFGVPVALANYVALEWRTNFKAGDLFIPKKVWSIEKKRFLTFREILELGVGRWLDGKAYERAGLEVIENTAQEILDLAREMNERLDGSFKTTEEDDELQRAFLSQSQPHHYCYRSPAHIGTRFLRENKELLE